MNIPILSVFASLILICFGAFILSSFSAYKNRFNVKYNPLNMFPYELNFEATFKDNFLGNLFLFFISILGIVFYSFTIKGSTSGFTIILVIGGIISSLATSFIALTPLKLLKTHLLVTVIYFVSVFVSIVGNALIAFDYHSTFYTDTTSLIMMITCIVFASIYLIIVFNPKMTLFAKLEKVENSDGTFYYQRPKFFVLAYTEWLTIIFYLINIVLTLINVILKLL